MISTSLTVGGFNQPSVARTLIELPGNAEKGLRQRFLWLFPRPVYGHFDSLEPTDNTFTHRIGKCTCMYLDKIIHYKLYTFIEKPRLLQLRIWLLCGGREQP